MSLKKLEAEMSKPNRVTDFSTTLVSLPVAGYLILNDRAKELIRTYGKEVAPFGTGILHFEIASHRWAEIAEAAGLGRGEK